MVKSYQLVLIGLFCCTFAFFGFIFFYLQKSYDETNLQASLFPFSNIRSEPKSKTETPPHGQLVHVPEEEQDLPINFAFRMHSRRRLRPTIKQIPSSVSARGSALFSWTIANFLDFWYPDWSKYFSVTETTLKKSIERQNHVTYQPLKTAILKTDHRSAQIVDLHYLNIDHRKLNISEEALLAFLRFLRDESNNEEAVKNRIKQVFPASNVASVTKKITESFYFYP